MKIVILIISLIVTLQAKSGVDIGALIKPSFSEGIEITKRQFKLNKKSMKKIEAKAQAKLDSNVIRFYRIKKEHTIEGYAVLMIQKVRTKKTAVLYIIDKQIKIKDIEIVAFNEPLEYKPQKNWQESFKGKSQESNLFVGKEIPTISGATLSARAITDASRLALAIVELYQ